MADIDLKVATPAASISDTGFLFGAESQGDPTPTVYKVSAIRQLRFHVTGKYYLGSASRAPAAGGAGTAVGTNALWASPVEIREAITIDALGARSGNATSAGNVRFGIYTSDIVTKRPGLLLAETGAIAVAASTAADIVGAFGSPLNISPNIYWFAMVADTSASFIALANTNAENNILMGGTLTEAVSPSSWAANHFRRTASHAFGAMPASFGAGTDNNSTAMPCIAYRVG